MAVFSIKSFGGIAPVVPPRYLQDNQAHSYKLPCVSREHTSHR